MSHWIGDHCVFSLGGFIEPPAIEEVESRQLVHSGAMVRMCRRAPLAVSTGAAVALANHYAKGNAAAKEAMDRISGSGVFARDPDSLVTFTRHEEDNAYTVDTILRNFPPVKSFVVRWDWPLFMRADELDPKRLRTAGGRPAEYTPDMLLDVLGDERLTSTEWQSLCATEHGISEGTFSKLRKSLERSQRVLKSEIDRKWVQIHQNRNNSNHESHQ